MAGFLSEEIEMADGVAANVGTSDNTVCVRHSVYLHVEDDVEDHYFWLEPAQARALAAQLIAAADHAEGVSNG